MPDDCKLYVANLSSSFTDTALKAMFEPFGNVLYAAVVTDPVTGQSRGFGFVHFPDNTTANIAAQGMNGRTIDGRALVVRLRSDAPQRGGPRESKGPMEYEYDERKLYVSHLPPSINEQELHASFGKFGPVLEVKLITDRATGQSKGYAFVTMQNTGAAQNALQSLHNNYKIDGRTIQVRVAGQRETTGPPRPPGSRPGGPPMPGMPGGHMGMPQGTQSLIASNIAKICFGSFITVPA